MIGPKMSYDLKYPTWKLGISSNILKHFQTVRAKNIFIKGDSRCESFSLATEEEMNLFIN